MNAHIPRCQYIKVDGRRCGSPALKTKRWCYFHYEVNRPTYSLDIPPLEDGDAVQLALTDLARAVADSRIEPKPAALLAYILQTASANLKRVHIGCHTSDMVRDLPPIDAYTRGPSYQEEPASASSVEEQGFSPAERNRTPAPSTLPKAGEHSSVSSVVKGSHSHPSAPSAEKVSAPSAFQASDPLSQKIKAAKAGSLKDAKGLLGLAKQIS